MDNQLNRYYIKIRTILEIDPKTIYEELVIALGPSASSYTTVTRWTKRFRKEREDVSDHPRSASSLSQLTLNWFDKLSAKIHISTYDEIIAETPLSLMVQ